MKYTTRWCKVYAEKIERVKQGTFASFVQWRFTRFHFFEKRHFEKHY
jgi:hypothetical protein